MTKAYPSNLTQAQYELLSDMIPEAKPGGRSRSVEMWEVLNAIFYVRKWRACNSEHCQVIFPSGKRCTPIFGSGARMARGCKCMIVYESGRESNRSAIAVLRRRSLTVKV